MKYSEFEKSVKSIRRGWHVRHGTNMLAVYNDINGLLAKVSKEKISVVEVKDYPIDVTDSERFELMEICVRLAKTLLPYREEAKRYRIKIQGFNRNKCYLNLSGEEFMLNDPVEINGYQTVFTGKEIIEIDNPELSQLIKDFGVWEEVPE